MFGCVDRGEGGGVERVSLYQTKFGELVFWRVFHECEELTQTRYYAFKMRRLGSSSSHHSYPQPRVVEKWSPKWLSLLLALCQTRE